MQSLEKILCFNEHKMVDELRGKDTMIQNNNWMIEE